MNKTFKKITASIMAVTSLTVSMIGISANATEVSPRYSGPTGYVSFGDGATAGIYVDSKQINASTTRNVTTYEIYVGITTVYNGTISGTRSVQKFNDTSASINRSGSNITGAATKHYYDTTASSSSGYVEKELVRYC